MEALTSSSSKIMLNKYTDTSFLSSKGIYLDKPEILFLPSKKFVNDRVLQQKTMQTISALASDAQAERKTLAESHIAYESETVHVKFQLQKECLFGEQFFIVGDDPMLGLWDPTSAIPLDWSDEHMWTAELDIPVGKSILFKFILRESTGDIVWQPGPDRIFQTRETKNTITVCEDWESAEYQKITEEDPTANTEMLVANNVTQPEKSQVSNMNNMSVTADSNMNSSKIPEKPTAVVPDDIGYSAEDPILNKNTKMLGEKQSSQQEMESVPNKHTRTEEDVLGNSGRATLTKNLVAENIVYPKKDPVLNASNNMLGENQISRPKEESVANKSTKTEEDVLANNRRVASTKNLASADVRGNLITSEGDAVLVPGLPPLPMSAEAKIKHEDLASADVKGNLITCEGDAVLVPGLPPLPMSAEAKIEHEDLASAYVKGNQITSEGDAVLVPGLPPLPMSAEAEIEHEDQTEEDVPANNRRTASTKNVASADVKGNLITSKGDAVLVPGLPPLPISAEAEIEHEHQKSIPLDGSDGINEAMNYILPELDEKQERENDQHKEKKIEIFNEEELKPMPHLAKQEQRPDAKPLGSDVAQNDIQWGRRTLQKFVAKFMAVVASW